MNKKILAVFDVEVYRDYFLLSVLSLKSGTIKEFELYHGQSFDKKAVSEVMQKATTIGFNSNNFDIYLVLAAIKGYRCDQLKGLCDELINTRQPWQVARQHNLSIPKSWDTIDLIEVAPGQASLKIYGGRLHSEKLQDLPISPDSSIAPNQRETLRLYCRNDLYTTRDLFNAVQGAVNLRDTLSDQYKMDLRSKSDAQVAEALIANYLSDHGVVVSKRTTPVRPFKYRVPEWVSFESPELQSVLDLVKHTRFAINETGSVVMPEALNKAIDFAGSKYKFGIGGLHSQEKRQVIEPAHDEMFGEYDLTSMYPSIILEQQLYPEHLGAGFLDVYRTIYSERVAAKRAKDKVKDAMFKICLNGSYGKFGSKYSYLYSPELMIQTTITGQLSLLMMIERFHAVGARVVSANTDGINVVFKRDKHPEVEAAVIGWELETGYNFEWTPYAACYSRDVNNYIAIKDGGIKGKGAFADGGLMKNPSAQVCVMAVKEYLLNRTPIDSFIRSCDDVRRFICVRQVTGGAVWRSVSLGKAVRWYYSTDGDTIHYAKNNNKVPKTDGAKPLMDLTSSIPNDLDFTWYVDEANSILRDLGC